MSIIYKQKNGSQYRVINSAGGVVAGVFLSEGAVNNWLSNNGYVLTPCCEAQSFSGTGNVEGYQVHPPTGLFKIETPINISVSLVVNWEVYDKPNRMTIYNNDNEQLWTSGWKGFSNDPGPWGDSLDTDNTGNITLVSSKGFNLKVEGYGVGDNWNINTTCYVNT